MEVFPRRVASKCLAPLALAVCCALPIGCDDRVKPVGNPAAATQATAAVPLMATKSDAPVPSVVRVEAVAAMTSKRTTLLAVTPDGTVFAVQPPTHAGPGAAPTVDAATTGAGDVIAFKLPPEGGRASPHPTQLTRAAVLKSLGIIEAEKPGDDVGGGQFAAIAARSDGRLAFCFVGVSGASPLVAIGTFDPADGTIFAAVDQITLASVDKPAAGDAPAPADPSRATRFVQDLATGAARPSLFTFGDDAWLWRADEREIRVLSINGLSGQQPKLAAARMSIEALQDSAIVGATASERSAWEWSATATPGRFLLTDVASRWIRRIDDQGKMTHVARFDADPQVATLAAATLDAAGRVIVFACDREGAVRSLLVQDKDAFKPIAASAFATATPLDAGKLRIDRLLPVPGQVNTYVAYDTTSGAVARVTLK